MAVTARAAGLCFPARGTRPPCRAAHPGRHIHSPPAIRRRSPRARAAFGGIIPGAAQETFARLWERRHTLDLTADIVPLAITIEHRLLTDRWRALRRRLRLAFEPVHPWSAAGSDEWADLQAAFGRLTPTERVAVTAVAVSGLSYAQVGQALGISEGAARAAASRGRRKLAAAIQE